MTENNKNIPVGDKDSALGVIPLKWEVTEFGDFSERSKEKYSPNANLSYRCIELEHVLQQDGQIEGYVDSSKQKSMKNLFHKDQVLFGKLRPYLRKYWLANYTGVCSSEIWVLKNINNKCSSQFLYSLIQSDKFIQICNVSSGSRMPRADWEYVAAFPFLLPPPQEQEKITKILSLWGDAIEKQKKLVGQLELRKRGLMQQLLTAKIRIGGFIEAWEEAKLKNVFIEYKAKPSIEVVYEVLTSSKKGLVKQLDYYGNNRITNREDADYNVLPLDYLTYRSRSDDGLFTFNKNNIALGLISGYYPVFTSKEQNNIDFLLLYLNYYKTKLTKYSIGTSQLVLSYNALTSAKFNLPSPKEQTFIANILTTAEQEISLAKKKLDLFRTQKRALMQQLLTGKTRVNS